MADITITLGVDMTEVNNASVDVDAVKEKSDAVVKEWRLRRMEIIQGVREGITLVSSMMSSYRQFMGIVGAQIDPFFSALISMTLSTISMILSVAAGLAATGVYAWAAGILGSVAIAMNVTLIAKLLIEKEQQTQVFSKMGAQIGASLIAGLSEQTILGS